MPIRRRRRRASRVGTRRGDKGDEDEDVDEDVGEDNVGSRWRWLGGCVVEVPTTDGGGSGGSGGQSPSRRGCRRKEAATRLQKRRGVRGRACRHVQTARRLYSDGTMRVRVAETEIEGNKNKSNRKQEVGARGQTAVGQRETERAGNKSKGERERVGARGARKGASGTRDSSGARKWCDARAPKRRSAPAAAAATARQRLPNLIPVGPRGLQSVSRRSEKRGDYFHCMLVVLREGGEKGAFPLAFHLSPSSIFRITPSLALCLLRSRSRASMSRAMPVQPPCASFSPPLARTH